MNLYAAIDIGTNSTRLLVARVEGGQVRPVHTAMKITRLGEGMREGPVLKAVAVNRTLKALAGFWDELTGYHLSGADVVATSAAREAKNGTDFAVLAERVVGWPVRIIDGKEEARLSYIGAATAVNCTGHPVVVDIGGGSTEITMRQTSGQFAFFSHPVGAVRCTENAINREEMLEVLRPGLDWVRELSGVFLVGVGGTVTTLAAMIEGMVTYDPRVVHGYWVSGQQAADWRDKLAAMPESARKQVPGLQPQRADIIVAGIDLLLVILTYLGLPGMTVSEADILYGMVLDMAGAGDKPRA